MVEITRDGTRIEQLKALALVIAERIDNGGDSHSMAQLSRQYRETLKEISELESDDDNSGPIAGILASRDDGR